MGIWILAVLVFVAIIYGGIVVRVYSKKVGIDINRQVQHEIQDKIEKSIHYVEELARYRFKAYSEVMSSVEKAKTAAQKVCDWVPDLSLEQAEEQILAALPQFRNWVGDQLLELSEKVSDKKKK